MRFTFRITVLFIVVILASCGPSDEDNARIKLNLAKSLLQKNDTAMALKQLDSIRIMFPEAAYSVNAAKNLIN